MKVNLDDLAMAVDFTSDNMMDSEAYLNKETGEFHYDSDAIDEELPDDIDDDNKYVIVPSKHELDLGQSVVFDFTRQEMPKELDNVYQIFRSRGAYSRFKSLLNKLNMTDKWYAFEEKATYSVLIAWCEEQAIDYKIPDNNR